MEWNTVYAELGIPEMRSSQQRGAKTVAIACETDEVLFGSDVDAANKLAIAAARYGQRHTGTLSATSVFPVPIHTLYMAICTKYRATPNTVLLNSFDRAETNASLTVLDLQRNYIGGGVPMRAIVAFLRECVNVTAANFASQRMEFDAMKDLICVLKSHQSLRRIDLRGNYIEGEHARQMVSVVRSNVKIVEILFDEKCHVPPTMRQRIAQQLAKNTQITKNVHLPRGVLGPLPEAIAEEVYKLSQQL